MANQMNCARVERFAHVDLRSEIRKWNSLRSVAGALPAVDMQGLAGDESSPFEIHDPVDHVTDLAEPAQGADGGHSRVGGGLEPRSPNQSNRHGVDPYAASSVLTCPHTPHRAHP